MKVLSRFKYFLLSLLAGSLLILAFPYPDLGFLAFFGLIPLLIVSYQLPPVKSLLYGLLTGLIFFSGISYWISIYGYLPLVLLTLLMALSLAIFAFLVSYARNLHLSIKLFFVPSIWVFLEFLRSEFGSWSFSYGVLGYSQHKFLLLLQFASILGVYGISFVIVMANVVLSAFVMRLVGIERVERSTIRADRDVRPYGFTESGPEGPPLQEHGSGRPLGRLLFLQISLLLLILGYGFVRLNSNVGADLRVGLSLKVAVVQVSIPQKLKWLSSEDGRIMDKYERATLKTAKGHPDLIVLPESALPAYVTEEDPLFQAVQDWARRAKTSLLVGVPFIGDDDKSYNTARLFSSDGQVVGTYAKIYPVPFGEFTPIRPVTEKIRPDATVRGDVAPGRKLAIFKIQKPVGADARPAEGGASVRPLK
ncbi:MAG: apolipoprotein N-acyltransferase, partial [Actinomycetota bacterium]